MLPSDPGIGYIPPADDTDWYLPDEHLRWLTRRTVGEAAWPVADGALPDDPPAAPDAPPLEPSPKR